MRKYRMRKGVTIIEAVMFMLIIAVLSGATFWIMAYTVKNSVFIPNQLNMDKLANDALNIMIEGDSQAKGLRFSRVVSAIAVNQLTFTNQEGIVLIYRWDTVLNKLYRKIGAATETVMPSYFSNTTGVTLSGKSGTLFTYYDSDDAVTAIAANARRIQIILIAKSGTGLYNDWQGQSEQASSVSIGRLE